MSHPDALDALAAILRGQQIDWALIGALAANRYRRSPRTTQDIDLLLADTGRGLEFLEDALAAGDWQVRRADAQGQLLRLIHPLHGVADLLIAGTDYELMALERAVRESVNGVEIPIVSPEDAIVLKLVAGRFQDLADIESILASGIQLDLDWIERWATYWDVADRWQQFDHR